MATKIVIIGGGSYGWTPTLVRDTLVTLGPEAEGQIWLVDLDSKALADLERCSQAIIDRTGSKFKVHTTGVLTEALPGADFVVITVSTGGLEAMRHDIEIPLKYGIYQPVGDTVGPGGISRTLRNVPVFVDFAEKIKRHCPDAWVLNITNPMTVLTQVLIEAGCKAVGLCHELYTLSGMLKEHFGCQWQEISLSVAGVNHFAFILKAQHRDIDCFTVFDEWAKNPRTQVLTPELVLTHERTHLGKHVYKLDNYRRTGRMLYPGDRHTAEFTHNVLTDQTERGALYSIKLTTIDERYEWLADSKKRVKQWVTKPEELPLEASREPVAYIIKALTGGEPWVDVVNLRNEGQIDNLPRGCVVETMATISAGQIIPHAVGALPDDIVGQIYPYCVRFDMLIESALKGDRRLALQAMCLDCLVRDYQIAEQLLDELLEANRQFLPQFFQDKPAGKVVVSAAAVNPGNSPERQVQSGV